MTEADRAALLERLAAAERRFLESIEGVTAEDWGRRPNQEQWSIAQCAEHIVHSESAVFRRLKIQLRRPSESTETPTRSDVELEDVVKARRQKVKSSAAQEPAGDGDRDALLQQFLEVHGELKEFVRTTDADLRSNIQPHAHLGVLDGHQWMLFVASHCERHVLQIEEVKVALGLVG